MNTMNTLSSYVRSNRTVHSKLWKFKKPDRPSNKNKRPKVQTSVPLESRYPLKEIRNFHRSASLKQRDIIEPLINKIDTVEPIPQKKRVKPRRGGYSSGNTIVKHNAFY